MVIFSVTVVNEDGSGSTRQNFTLWKDTFQKIFAKSGEMVKEFSKPQTTGAMPVMYGVELSMNLLSDTLLSYRLVHESHSMTLCCSVEGSAPSVKRKLKMLQNALTYKKPCMVHVSIHLY